MTVRTDTAFNLVTDLLKVNRGVFIGETHDNHLASDFVNTNFEALKKQGVSTIYVELSDPKLRAVLGGDDCRDGYVGPTNFPDNNGATPIHSVIRNAVAAGIRVIGHDSLTGNAYQWDRIDTDKSGATLTRIVAGKEALDKRDDYAAGIIEQTYDGKKFIAYGGIAHSGKSQTRPDGRGLPERLAIPSVDFMTPGDYGKNEPSLSLTGQRIRAEGFANAIANRQQPIYIKSGAGGESTYKVTSYNKRAFFNNETPEYSADGEARLKAAAAQAKAEGACSVPAHLEKQDYLGPEDAKRIVARAKQQEAPRR